MLRNIAIVLVLTTGLARADEETPKQDWVLEEVDRTIGPGFQVLNKGMVAGTAQLGIVHQQLTLLGVTAAATVEALDLRADFAATDQLQLGVGYGFVIHDGAGSFPSDDRWKGTLAVRGAFVAGRGKSMKAAITGTFLYNVQAEAGSAATGLALASKLGPNVALYTPGNQLVVDGLGGGGDKPVYVLLPVGIAVQASPNVYLFADTVLARLKVANSTNAYIGSDFVPFSTGATIALQKTFELGASFTTDLKRASDFYVIGVFARIYAL